MIRGSFQRGSPGKKSPRNGFSLTELLVILCLMGLLSAGAVSLFSNTPTPGAITNGSDLLTSVLREAQLLAYSSQCETGVIIENSPGSPTHLCRLAVVQQVNGNWQIASRTRQLPRGVYFVPGDSNAAQMGQVTFPRQAAGSQNYVFKFNPQGFADPADGQAVLSAAALSPSGSLILKPGLARQLTIRKLGQVMSCDCTP